MRICMVTVAGHAIGGMQDHTRSLARGLVTAGHQVEIITTRHPKGIREEERGGARWHYVDAAGHHPWLPRRDPAWLRRSYEAFARLQGKRAFDVIHSESASAIGLVRRGVHRRVPVVAKYHGNGMALTRAALARARGGDTRAKVREAKGLVWLFAEWLQYGHWYRFRPCVWIVPSRREFEDTRRSAFLQDSLGHVVPNGIDAELFRPRQRSEVRAELGVDDGVIFVCVGRLNFEKGIHYAVSALARLRPGPKLVIVGDGEERERLEGLARALGLNESVRFVGGQPPEMVAKYLGAADVFLFPTERAEAFGIALAEAMASGLPVVASDTGAVRELMGNPGLNGLIVPPGDVDALASEMRTLLADTALRQRLGGAARRRVLAEYTVERMVEETLDVYRLAIARSRASPDE